MKTILFSISFLVYMVRVQSQLEANLEHFVMAEAHISEYRVNENTKWAYTPFYIECKAHVFRHSCWPAIPKINPFDGYVNFNRSNIHHIMYYGCPQTEIPKNVLNPEQHFQKELQMKEAKSTTFWSNGMTPYYSVYEHRCVTEVIPAIWRIGHQNIVDKIRVQYGIGFLIRGVKNMPIAEVYYHQQKKIPIWTKHILHGTALASPIDAFKSVEEIVYQEDLENFTDVPLKLAIMAYFEFNENNSEGRKNVNRLLKSHGMNEIPKESLIVIGHLIPEYDMITSTWQKASQFAQTIVPTWRGLYLIEWNYVEEMIREVSFMHEANLTVYSGAHGQLTFNVPVDKAQQEPPVDTGRKVAFKLPGDGSQQTSDIPRGDNSKLPKFFLKEKWVVVPEMIWKIAIYSKENSTRKQATVIVFHNLTKELKDLNIFTEFTPPCNTICKRFKPRPTDEPSVLIYCCTVNEVKGKIELPNDVLGEDFGIFFR